MKNSSNACKAASKTRNFLIIPNTFCVLFSMSMLLCCRSNKGEIYQDSDKNKENVHGKSNQRKNKILEKEAGENSMPKEISSGTNKTEDIIKAISNYTEKNPQAVEQIISQLQQKQNKNGTSIDNNYNKIPTLNSINDSSKLSDASSINNIESIKKEPEGLRYPNKEKTMTPGKNKVENYVKTPDIISNLQNKSVTKFIDKKLKAPFLSISKEIDVETEKDTLSQKLPKGDNMISQTNDILDRYKKNQDEELIADNKALIWGRDVCQELLDRYLSETMGNPVLFISNLFRSTLNTLFSKEELKSLNIEVLKHLLYFIACLENTKISYKISSGSIVCVILLLNESINNIKKLDAINNDLEKITTGLKKRSIYKDNIYDDFNNFIKCLDKGRTDALGYPNTLKECEQGINEKNIFTIEKQEQRTGQFLAMSQKALGIYCTTALLYKYKRYGEDDELDNTLNYITEHLIEDIKIYKKNSYNIEIWQVAFVEKVCDLIKSYLKTKKRSLIDKTFKLAKKTGNILLEKIRTKLQKLP